MTDLTHLSPHMDRLIAVFCSKAQAEKSLDVQDLFARFTMDVAGIFLFGISDFNTLSLPLPIPGKAILGFKGTVPSDSDTNTSSYLKFVNGFELLQWQCHFSN